MTKKTEKTIKVIAAIAIVSVLGYTLYTHGQDTKNDNTTLSSNGVADVIDTVAAQPNTVV